MRKSTRISIVGSGVAVAGTVAIAALAPGAAASPGQASATTYNSTATATIGDLILGGTSQSLLPVTATTGNSPKSASIGSAPLISALNGVPVIGPPLAAAFQAANPSYTDVATERATASAGGTSTACAAVLAADCTSTPNPVVLNVGFNDLSSVLGTLPTPLPGGLSAYDLVLTLHGPQASCSAGPAGSGQLSANADVAGATAEITQNGTPVAGPVTLDGGSIWNQLLTAAGNTSVLAPALQLLNSNAPLSLIINPNSTKSTSGSTATATAGELGLASGGTTLLDAKTVSVSCGPNTMAATTSPSPSPSSPTTGTPAPSPTTGAPSPTGEEPLGGIQTDEGRSSVPAGSWLALNGMP